MFQDENVQYIAVDQNQYIAVDQNDDFIEVPFVSTARSFALDAIREMTAKPVRPKPDRFPADDHAAFSQQIFNIRRTQGKAMIRPYCTGDDLTRAASL